MCFHFLHINTFQKDPYMENSSDDRKIKFAFHEKCTDSLFIRLVNDFEQEKQSQQLGNNEPIIEFDKRRNDTLKRLR